MIDQVHNRFSFLNFNIISYFCIQVVSETELMETTETTEIIKLTIRELTNYSTK